MNKLVLSFIFVILSSYVYSQVSYGDTTWGNYNMKINVATENDSIFLTLTYTHHQNKLLDTPKLLLRFMDESTLSLEGELFSTSNKNYGGIVVSGILVSSDYYISEAKFSISKEQMNHFKVGVKKLRLNTSPKYHEKEWKRDKIGAILYDAYIKSSGNSFEDNF